ncbi:Chorismate mutase / Prephenate dehydratase [Candidatus Magnetomoraceae bacterium gMMP-15]
MKNDKEADWQVMAGYRDEIDLINNDIISLLSRRQDIAAEIGKIKRSLDLGVFNMAREEELLRDLCSKARNNLTKEAIKYIFSEIISAARSVQQPINVAYLGPEATFSHQAAICLFGHSTSFRAAETIEDVFSLVEKGVCQQGLVPIENSYEGSITMTMDLFYKYDLKIDSEVFLRIRHHLLSKENNADKIKTVYSHPMAIAQCHSWLKSNLFGVTIKKVESTSLAAKMAAEENGTGAIGSRLAARTYGLNMLNKNIEDHPDNVTRFLAIGKTYAEATGKDKTSLLFFLGHKPGSLFNVLEPLTKRNINMSRIESRPMKISNWEYLFFVDIEGHQDEDNVNKSIKEMEEKCAFMKILGSYPVGGEPWD